MVLSGHQSLCWIADLVLVFVPLIGTMTFVKLSVAEVVALLFRAMVVDASCLLSTMGLADFMISSYCA